MIYVIYFEIYMYLTVIKSQSYNIKKESIVCLCLFGLVSKFPEYKTSMEYAISQQK